MMPFQMYLYEHYTIKKDFMITHLVWVAIMLKVLPIIIRYRQQCGVTLS